MYFAQLDNEGKSFKCYVAEKIIIDDDILYSSELEKEVDEFCERWNKEIRTDTKSENLVIDRNGVIICRNADDTDEGLGEMGILVADCRPMSYLKCISINNKKVYVVSDEEVKRIDGELKKAFPSMYEME